MNNVHYINSLLQAKNTEDLFKSARRISKEIYIFDLESYGSYQYVGSIAMEALGIEEELLNELLDDYVVQIIRAIIILTQQLHRLNNQRKLNQTLDFTELRELIHKNLGVARNLRIEDAEILLKIMIEEDNLELIMTYIIRLLTTVILLDAKTSYEVLALINIK